MDPVAFDLMLSGEMGSLVRWARSHRCPCLDEGGGASQECLVCLGKGIDPALRLLAVRNVEDGSHVPDEVAPLGPPRKPLVEHPPVLAVVAPQAIFHFEGSSWMARPTRASSAPTRCWV